MRTEVSTDQAAFGSMRRGRSGELGAERLDGLGLGVGFEDAGL